MTKKERANPQILQASRKKRIAAGAGQEVPDLNKLLKMHRQMADMMKRLGKMGWAVSRCRRACRGWGKRNDPRLSAAPERLAARKARGQSLRARRARPLDSRPSPRMTGTTIHIPTLQTDRLTLRAPKLADFEHWAAFFASPRSVHERGMMDRADAWRVWAADVALWMLRGYGAFGCDDRATGAYVGEVGIYRPEGFPEPELGWFVVPEAEGQGYAAEAASIDRLDAILVYTLGERFKHTQAVGKLKAEHDLPPSDPAREAAQIARLEDLAKRGRSGPGIRQEVPELHHR
jgi:monofunctional chorismate mutase